MLKGYNSKIVTFFSFPPNSGTHKMFNFLSFPFLFIKLGNTNIITSFPFHSLIIPLPFSSIVK
ncbi:hypothetical protein HanIR_Chr07g0322911 [Helianthus annuus]|nr:hypothetical protein HanIR_Chr07g0322911 [Helianthus annuus]